MAQSLVRTQSADMRWITTLLTICALALMQVRCQALVEQEFTPTVTATCKANYMTIKIHTNQSFLGAVQARDFRSNNCMTLGDGGQVTTLGINLLATNGAPDYCGVLANNKTGERSVPIAVRIHKTLELADDKFYVITCGKAGFKNANNQTSLVSLRLLEKEKKVFEAVFNRQYTIRADISRPDGVFGIRVKSCIAFNKKNSSVMIIDERGCPVDKRVISQFKYDEKKGVADATISMFRFSDSPEVNFQCDIAVCRGSCPEVQCNTDLESLPSAQARALAKDIYTEASAADEGVLMASTSVYVVDPGDHPVVQELCEGGVHPPWLLWLCIALGIMFLIMLIINIFLCSAMTCSCARTEIIEKDPSIIEDYDPYRSWHGSQYGSRYSLNGKPGYASGGSTIHSTRSMSTNSDHYAIVHSRPGSRYSGHKSATLGNPHNGRGQSHLGSHYSVK